MADNNTISGLRREYNKYILKEKNLKNNPVDQFRLWFEEALNTDIIDPTAMALSTADKNGRPSSRMVLLKDYNETGFVFYTNYESRKGIEIGENPYASILFFWDIFERQIRINGRIEKTSKEESYEYFKTRPLTSRLGAVASAQSRELKSRFSLMREVAKLFIKHPVNVPLPDHWGGYRLIPDEFEFWQGRESRLHDRFQYKLINNLWVIRRLYP